VQHLIVATRNAHKTREIQQILGSEFAVCDLCAYPEISEITESGGSFEENATLKAIATIVSHDGSHKPVRTTAHITLKAPKKP